MKSKGIKAGEMQLKELREIEQKSVGVIEKEKFYVPASFYPKKPFPEIESLRCTWFLASVITNMEQGGFCPSDERESLPFRLSQPNMYHMCKANSILMLSFWVFICPRFRPHQDADPEKPRVAALIDRLISFKNNDHGAWVRGGDILIQNSG